jgi:hypothetical protein
VSDDGTLDVLRASGVRAVVLTAAALPPARPSPTPERLGRPRERRLAAARGGQRPDDLGAWPTPARTQVADGPPDPVEQRQQAPAEVAMTSLERCRHAARS